MSNADSYMHHAGLMAARRTLQEGVLSGSLVFPLDGSLAYLKLLWPEFDAGLSFSDVQWAGRKLHHTVGRLRNSNNAVVDEDTPEKEVEIPCQNRVRNDLFVFAKASLNVEEYDDYARGPVSDPNATSKDMGTILRCAKLVKKHASTRCRMNPNILLVLYSSHLSSSFKIL